MAVTLRLARHGQPHRPIYRIVAATKTKPRNGKFLEILGTFNPMVEPPAVKLAEERAKFWIEQGALPSSAVRDLIRKQIPGFIEAREKHALDKVQAARKARKERAKKVAKKK